jgi:hypothetical protein
MMFVYKRDRVRFIGWAATGGALGMVVRCVIMMTWTEPLQVLIAMSACMSLSFAATGILSVYSVDTRSKALTLGSLSGVASVSGYALVRSSPF